MCYQNPKKKCTNTCSVNCSLNCNGTKFSGWQWWKRSLERSNRGPHSTCYHHFLSAEEQSKSHNPSHNCTHIPAFSKCLYLLLFYWWHSFYFILQVFQSTKIFTNACSMESKHKEIGVQLQQYKDHTAVVTWLTWLECCHARQRGRGEAVCFMGQKRWSALSSALELMMFARILNILEQRGIKYSWLMFKDCPSKVQSNPFQQAVSQVKTPGWTPKYTHKNEPHRRWKWDRGSGKQSEHTGMRLWKPRI